ncbi:MAG: DNA/RNA nuclease SfsA, partial [Candidatus Sifarchaeia archaeon]
YMLKRSMSTGSFTLLNVNPKIFSPNDETDPKFGEALRYAHTQGVDIIPLSTEIIDWSLSLIGVIPFRL